MAINAITSLFGSSGINYVDLEHEEIKRQLRALGLEVTGQKTVDKATLRTALIERAQKQKEAEEPSSTAQTTQTSEETKELTQTYTSILIELGVTQSDDVQKDYDQAIKQLEYKLRNATDESDRRHLLKLKSDLDYEVNAMGYSLQSLSSSVMTGATAVGELNKQMLVMAGGFSTSGK